MIAEADAPDLTAANHIIGGIPADAQNVLQFPDCQKKRQFFIACKGAVCIAWICHGITSNVLKYKRLVLLDKGRPLDGA